MWGGFAVTLPWHMYVQYGDKGALEANYPMIQKWLASLLADTTDNVLLGRDGQPGGRGMMNFIGDWLTPKGSYSGNTPTAQILNSAHLVYELRIASKIATALGKAEDASPMRPGRTPSPRPPISASTTPPTTRTATVTPRSRYSR